VRREGEGRRPFEVNADSTARKVGGEDRSQQSKGNMNERISREKRELKAKVYVTTCYCMFYFAQI